METEQVRPGILLVLLLLVPLLLAGCGRSDIPAQFEFDQLRETESDPLIIGQVPSRSVIELFEQRKTLLRLLSKQLDRHFELRVADTYDDIVSGMKQGQYDLVVLGPLAYVQAVDDSGASYRPLARPVRYGNPNYRSIIITREDSNIDDLSDIRGQSMAFVDPTSTSGYLFPRAHIIRETGFDPLVGTSRSAFLGGHDKVVEAVLDGTFAAGAVFDDARTLVLDDRLEEQLPVVARSRPIPSEPIAVRTGLPDRTIDQLKTFFLSMHQSHPDVMKTMGSNIDRYVETDDAVYDEVRAVMSVLKEAPSP